MTTMMTSKIFNEGYIKKIASVASKRTRNDTTLFFDTVDEAKQAQRTAEDFLFTIGGGYGSNRMTFEIDLPNNSKILFKVKNENE